MEKLRLREVKKVAQGCTAKSEVSTQSLALLFSFKPSIIAAPWMWEDLVRMKRRGGLGTGRREGAVTSALWSKLIGIFLRFISLFIYLATKC